MQLFQRVVPLVAACLLVFSVSAGAAQNDAQKNVQANAQNPAQQQQQPQQQQQDAVNLNNATVAQLETLKGVGKARAQAIIEYRDKQGKFQAVQDLSKVRGLSEKTVATLLENNPNRIIVE